MRVALARWRKPTATHDPAKVVLDLAVTLALGGDCLADIALLRGQPGVYGLVASDPTVSRVASIARRFDMVENEAWRIVRRPDASNTEH
jgi:hypothetical protein